MIRHLQSVAGTGCWRAVDFLFRFMVGAASFAILCGCASVGPDNPTSAGSIFSGKDGDRGLLREAERTRNHPSRSVDLLALLDPNEYRKELGMLKVPTGVAIPDTVQLEAAYRAFYDPRYGAHDLKARRHRVQDRLISASNESCRDYKHRLKGLQADTNILFGSLTTILAGAGAISTATDAARTLAGAAGILSGVRAEIHQGLFSTLAIEVISRAMERARERFSQTVRKEREEDAYTVERAVGDAIRYHDYCSLLGGLEEASNAVSVPTALSGGVGLDTLDSVMRSRAIAAGLSPSDTVFPDQENPVLQSERIRQDSQNLVQLTNDEVGRLKADELKKSAESTVQRLRASQSALGNALNARLDEARRLTHATALQRSELTREFDPAKRAKLISELSSTRAQSVGLIEAMQLQQKAFQAEAEVARREISGLLQKESTPPKPAEAAKPAPDGSAPKPPG